jgi:shikimate kinase
VSGVRVVLIGGTSHVGKSTLARALAADRGWPHLSTDRLARHPGRPWGRVPEHVREHYATLSVEELTEAQLRHYERMWPIIETTIIEAAGRPGGLVLEGSGIWPDRVAGLAATRVAATWLTASEAVLRDRIHAESRYPDRTAAQRRRIDAFVGRTLGYDRRLRESMARLGLSCVDVYNSPGDLAQRLGGGG